MQSNEVVKQKKNEILNGYIALYATATNKLYKNYNSSKWTFIYDYSILCAGRMCPAGRMFDMPVLYHVTGRMRGLKPKL
jgi:hypothetical protein